MGVCGNSLKMAFCVCVCETECKITKNKDGGGDIKDLRKGESIKWSFRVIGK